MAACARPSQIGDRAEGAKGWWLRSAGNNDDKAAFVNGKNGNVDDNGNHVNKEFGVRPAWPHCPKESATKRR